MIEMIKFLGSAGSAIGRGRLTSFFPFQLVTCGVAPFCTSVSES